MHFLENKKIKVFVADNDGFVGALEEKVGEQKLEAGETKKISYTMEFHR